MENNTSSIRWETTWNIVIVDLEDLKQFSLKDASPRKWKSTVFFYPSSGKKLHWLSNIKMTDLIWKVAQKIYFIVIRTLLGCALRVQLGIWQIYSIVLRMTWNISGILFNHLCTWFNKCWVNHVCQKQYKSLVANVIQFKKSVGSLQKKQVQHYKCTPY